MLKKRPLGMKRERVFSSAGGQTPSKATNPGQDTVIRVVRAELVWSAKEGAGQGGKRLTATRSEGRPKRHHRQEEVEEEEGGGEVGRREEDEEGVEKEEGEGGKRDIKRKKKEIDVEGGRSERC